MKKKDFDLICFIVYMIGLIVIAILYIVALISDYDKEVCYITRIDGDLKQICEEKNNE